MLRVAIIGTGVMGRRHAEAIRESDSLEIAAFVGRDPVKTMRLAEQYSARAYADMDEMLESESVDIVDICTPPFLHESAVKSALKHQKHIACEKPFALSYRQAEAMSRLIEEAGVKAMVLQVVRFWPEYARVRNLINEGVLGKVTHVSMCRLSVHPDWSQWHLDPEKSGGGLYDLHIHDIDFLHHVFGRVDTVYAVGHRSKTGCYNTVSTSLTFESGVTADVQCSMDMKGDYPFTAHMTAAGELGTLRYQNDLKGPHDGSAEPFGIVSHYKAMAAPEEIQVKAYDPYKMQLEYLAACINNDDPVDHVKMSEVLYVQRILEAIQKSLETGRVVTDL